MAHGDIFGCKYFQRREQLGDEASSGASLRKLRVRARWVPPKLYHHPPEAVRQGGEARLCTGCWESGEQAWVPACPRLAMPASLTYYRLHLLPWFREQNGYTCRRGLGTPARVTHTSLDTIFFSFSSSLLQPWWA